ncbi:MAG: EAL domain-containing protein [Acidimicrobiales bacterium]
MRTSSDHPTLAARDPLAAPRLDLAGFIEPIVDLRSGATVAVEVLLRPRSVPSLARWRRSVGPEARAEVLPLALELASAELEAGDVLVHVNATAADLEHPAFAARVLRAVPGAGRHRLVIELTEELPVRDRAAVLAATGRLREEGVRFALDDFGEGWSNFAAVQALRPEILKVTTAIVGPAHDPDLGPVVARFAREVGAASVIEQVEDEATATWARQVGFDLGQGWRWTRAGRRAGVRAAAGPLSR